MSNLSKKTFSIKSSRERKQESLAGTVKQQTSDLVFADGHSGICHIKGHRSPVFSVGRANQTFNGSVQYIHAWKREYYSKSNKVHKWNHICTKCNTAEKFQTTFAGTCQRVTPTYWSGHRHHAQVEDLKLLNQLRLWCGKLCWEKFIMTLTTAWSNRKCFTM